MSFTSNTVSTNGCIILFGESFRMGTQGNRNTGLESSYDGQIEAAKSHISFINEMKIKKNVNIDVYISSYETKFKDDFINVYKDVLIGSDFYKDVIGQKNLIYNTIGKLPIEKYDFLICMRIDLFLKPGFTEVFNPMWDKILWPSICFKPHHKSGIHPRVNDTIIFVPKKYYTYLKNLHYKDNCGDGHDQWAHFIENTGLTYNDLDTILNTFHDSDSAKDLNPLYYIVNRPQSNIHHTKGEIFDKTNF
jgi:hypothetical protein